MDLVVKSYPAGKMSKHMAEMKVGDSLEMKGPIPKIPYKANMKNSIGMVAGGTGITPMLQVRRLVGLSLGCRGRAANLVWRLQLVFKI